MRTVRKVLGAIRWYAREVTGEAEYDRYCERRRRHHPHAAVPTRREYEWMRTARHERETPSRCC
ncbi:YbdD/YjiX family protein [Streptomyces sp. TRM70350]|uniref:CstA-like transporter-associated (seleno)protein n=1 Tax=Streptomyces sp. TRM70350 TaxID=2856165 RepID=UPI001C470EDE|nr:YbdD/YjiX family protein [Streptomyces sp. TRM70350]MBV7699389.1 YbdD/YjiX family protein [Streptomyces sp. TRM70350]